MLAVSVLTLGLVTAGFVTHPISAVAAATDTQTATHAVLFQSQGALTQHVSSAPTVGAFLRERGIVPGPRDYVHPGIDTPLVDNIVVEYSPAVPVKFITKSGSRTIITTAPDVGAFIEEQHVQLGPHDVVKPALDDPTFPYATIRIANILKWSAMVKSRLAQHTIRKIDFSLAPGKQRVVQRGTPGLAVSTVAFTQTDGVITKRVVNTRVIRKPHVRIIAEGVGAADSIEAFVRHGLEKTSFIASNALEMIATAYTAGCGGCSGYTAIGYRAGHGIVAVDPHVIPLGTKLYIPGYGFAIAGDTGGAIVGRRIDLGFDSFADAMAFGKRVVKVYRLH
jgi:3D (Asp-Asp-Asp) domain-containing protein